MKRMAFYRRAGRQDSKNAGLKEKVVWKLSKGPATGRELSEQFGLALVDLNRIAAQWLRGKKIVAIEATDWVTGEDGIRDRTYRLVKKPQFVSPPGRTRPCTRRAKEQVLKGEREKNIEKARRRARLIAAGLYIDELG